MKKDSSYVAIYTLDFDPECEGEEDAVSLLKLQQDVSE